MGLIPMSLNQSQPRIFEDPILVFGKFYNWNHEIPVSTHEKYSRIWVWPLELKNPWIQVWVYSWVHLWHASIQCSHPMPLPAPCSHMPVVHSVYIYIYICVCVYMYMCVYVYMCICICVYIYIYMYICVNSVHDHCGSHCILNAACPSLSCVALQSSPGILACNK